MSQNSTTCSNFSGGSRVIACCLPLPLHPNYIFVILPIIYKPQTDSMLWLKNRLWRHQQAQQAQAEHISLNKGKPQAI
jgi:hypothetical protein